MKDLRAKTLVGLAWTVMSQASQQLLSFAVSVALTRLLTPEDFGLVGKVMVFVGFARVLGDFGFGSALIQDKQADHLKTTSVFWLNLALGLTLTLVLWLGAEAVARFYRDDALAPLLRWLSAGVTITAMSSLHRALLRKRMDFRSLAVADNAAGVLAGAVGIGMALYGLGPHAIVCQSLTSSAVVAAVLWWRSSFRPSIGFSAAAVRSLWRFSSNMIGSAMLNYWVRNLDNLLIGKYLGSAALGIYQRAYGLMLLPVNQLTNVTGLVMFPAMSAVQLEHERVKRIYLRAVAGIALLSAPVMLGMLVTAEPFVLTLYGERWREVIPLLRVLSLVGLAQAVNATVGWIYQSQGRTDLQFRFVVAAAALTYVAFAVGLRWGMMGVAVAYAIRVYSTIYFAYWIPGRLIGMKVGEVGKAVAGPLACALSMSAAVYALDYFVLSDVVPAPRLALLCAFGAALYLVQLRFFRVAAFQDQLALLRERLAKRRAR